MANRTRFSWKGTFIDSIAIAITFAAVLVETQPHQTPAVKQNLLGIELAEVLSQESVLHREVFSWTDLDPEHRLPPGNIKVIALSETAFQSEGSQLGYDDCLGLAKLVIPSTHDRAVTLRVNSHDIPVPTSSEVLGQACMRDGRTNSFVLTYTDR